MMWYDASVTRDVMMMGLRTQTTRNRNINRVNRCSAGCQLMLTDRERHAAPLICDTMCRPEDQKEYASYFLPGNSFGKDFFRKFASDRKRTGGLLSPCPSFFLSPLIEKTLLLLLVIRFICTWCTSRDRYTVEEKNVTTPVVVEGRSRRGKFVPRNKACNMFTGRRREEDAMCRQFGNNTDILLLLLSCPASRQGKQKREEKMRKTFKKKNWMGENDRATRIFSKVPSSLALRVVCLRHTTHCVNRLFVRPLLLLLPVKLSPKSLQLTCNRRREWVSLE